jgi:hypothetical protein
MTIRLVISIIAILLVSCDQEPFHLRERHVAGVYELEQWEDGVTFYLVTREDTAESGGGVLDGTVFQIGWNDRYIVAQRKANFAGDGDGWMIVDVSNNAVTGPYSYEELKSRAEIQGVTPAPAAEAWRRLK